MSANLQNILFHLEAAPPPAAWEAIDARLDAEFNVPEMKIAARLYDAEVPPPPGVWDRITIVLETAAEVKPAPTAPARVIRLPFRKVAVAAAVLALVIFGTRSFLNRAAGDPVVQQGQLPLPSNNLPVPVNDLDATPSLPSITAAIGSRQRTRINVARRISDAAVLKADYARNYLPETDNVDIHYAEMDGLRGETTTRRNGIKAPLIKDANGNIILDKSLLITRDNNYIIITSPNGEQTRLSTKFLPLLADLNGTTDPAEYFDAVIRESTIWKSRFSEWRYKLMQEASFAPTANNFLDIIALKDLIQENQ